MALPTLLPRRHSHNLLRRDEGSQLDGAAAAFTQWVRTQEVLQHPMSHVTSPA